MSLAEQIYFRSPLAVQNMMIGAWGLVWARRRFGGVFHAKVRELEANEWFTAEQFRQLQFAKLGRLLKSVQNSPYYKEAFRRAEVRLPLEGLDQLANLPILPRQTLRERGRDLLTAAPGWSVKSLKTSGSTGTPCEIFYTPEFHQEALAYLFARCRKWAGIAPGDSRAMFGGRKVCAPGQSRPPYWRRSPAENLTYFSSWHLSPKTVHVYAEELERLQPKLMMGFPSAMGVMARYLLEQGKRLSVKAIIPTAEPSPPEIRQACEAAFGGQYFDQYGSVENAFFAAECEHGRMHLAPCRGIVEILDDDDRPCPPGVVGRVIATGLENHLQPLIRYELGDCASWAVEQECPCGRQMPILGAIEGRIDDTCILTDGRQINRLDSIFKGLPTIREAQVIQEEPDRFVIKIVPADGFCEADQHRVRENLRMLAGDVRVEFETCDHIPRTSGGKFRGVLSRVGAAAARERVERSQCGATEDHSSPLSSDPSGSVAARRSSDGEQVGNGPGAGSGAAEDLPKITVIMPIRNESRFIERSLGAVLRQDYPADRIEVLVADGRSSDATREKVLETARSQPNISVRIVDNPGGIVPTGFNAAVRAASGTVIARVDGHTIIAADYLRQCARALARSGADNVGGRMTAQAETAVGQAVAAATSSRFGVGGSAFHYLDRAAWVDTVYLGCWNRSVFERVGLFDEEQVRNQDDEFNYRLRERGGRVLLVPEIRSTYYNRPTLLSLWRQYFQYGFWKVRVMQKHPGQMSPRHFIPALLVLTLLGGAVLSPFSIWAAYLLLGAGAVYTAALGGASLVVWGSDRRARLWLLPLVFACLHLGYGSGFLWGLVWFWNGWGRIAPPPLLAGRASPGNPAAASSLTTQA